jgi:iron complex outermembrane recepter protein
MFASIRASAPCRLLSASVSLLALGAGAAAQEAAPLEVIEVGGRAPGATMADRPVTILTGESLDRAGFAGLGDALPFVTAMGGSEFNEDPGTQNDTSGTANANLRGLGLGSTLVLLNGRRQTVSSVAADDGASFVDLNALVPSIAVGRVEVLKDGASPVYGSDAVAGVINVITRDSFTGLDAFAEWRGPTEYSGSGAGPRVAAIAGRDFGALHLTGAVEWSKRAGLEGFETDFVPGMGISTLGQPGGFYILNDDGSFAVTTPAGGPASVIDPDCAAAGGRPMPTGQDSAFGPVGSCGLDYAQFFSIVPEEETLSGYGALSANLGATRLTLRAAGTAKRLERGNSPSLADLSFPTVSANHPGNPFGRDVIFLGRPLGEAAGAARRTFEHDTFRLEAEAERDVTLGAAPFTLTGNYAYSRNELMATITDTLSDEFHAALAGFGGAACSGAQPGENGCEWFNPFGSGGLVTDPSDPRFNSPEVIDFIIGENVRRSRADLAVFEATAATPSLFALPAGDVSAAFGVQIRRESYRVENGERFNDDDFLFIVGGPDYAGARTAKAVFADAIAPVTDRLSLQLAVRHEDQGGFSSTDPKIGARFDATEALSFRGSFSRSFRAPSLHQQVSATTTLQSLTVGTSSLFRPVRTVGNPDLAPETADTFTGGAVWRGFGLSASLDYWRVEYRDLIVRENAQAIINEALENNLDDPRIDLSPAGEVVLVRSAFVNAPRVEADGIDLELAGDPIDLGGWGALSWGGSASWVTTFTLVDPVLDREIDGRGSRNFANFARSVPDFRASAHLDWSLGAFGARAGLRHIGGYRNDEGAGGDIASWTALDLQGSWTAEIDGRRVTLTAGAQNVTDEAPPFVQTPLGFDTKVHDPRGRIGYARIGVSF